MSAHDVHVTEPKYRDALQALESWVPDPRGGLPYDLFLFFTRFIPMVNVDLLIQDRDKGLLLTWRDDEFYGAGWHIPGGIIRYKETAEERIRATAQIELGATLEHHPEPVAVEQGIELERRERGHFVAIVYACRLTSEPDPERAFRAGTPVRGQWAWHRTCPPDLIPAQSAYRRFFPEGRHSGRDNGDTA
jgi:colanic acid biosynthesis protein WcaH